MKITMSDAWCYITEENFIPTVISSSLEYALIDEEKGTKTIKSLYIKEEKKFPSGSWWSVKNVLDRQNIFYVFEDKTVYPTGNEPIENGIHLRPYQQDGMNAFMNGANEFGARFRMIESISTGGGKTILAAKAIATINLPTIFFVHTKDLLVQTSRVLSELLGSDIVGTAGGGEDKYKNPDGSYKQIIVAMIQAFYYHGKKAGFEKKKEYFEILSRAKFMVCDESHHSSSDSWFWIAQQCPAPYRLGLTATPWRHDGKDLLLQAATGPVCHKISSKELVELGFLSRPLIKMYGVNAVLDSRFDDTTWPNKYKAGIVFNSHRNAVIAAAAVKDMLENRSVLIIITMKIHGIVIWQMINNLLNKRREKGEHIDDTCSAMFMNSEFDIDSRRMCLNMFRSGQLRCIIGTSIYDEGIDLPSVNTVIMAAGGKSDTKIIQRLGRSLRLGDRCLFITAGNSCTLLTEDPSKPFRCMELSRNTSLFNRKEVAEEAFRMIQDYIGNIKVFNKTTSEIVGKRPIWDANSQEILRMWEEVARDRLFSVPELESISPGIGERILKQYEICKSNLSKKIVEQQEIKLFRMCAYIISLDKNICIKCPHKKTKNEVKFIDFYDGFQEHLKTHSINRLKIYEYEDHDPVEGFVDEFINEPYQDDDVHNTQGCYIDMDEMMKNFPDFFTKKADDDIPDY